MLYGHPAVHQAAVFGVPSRVMGELVAAAVTLRPEAAAQVSGSGSPACARGWCMAGCFNVAAAFSWNAHASLCRSHTRLPFA